jgi:hypothetical protein
MMMTLLIAYYLILTVVFIARTNRKRKPNKPNRRIKPKSSLIRLLAINKSI